MGNEPESSSAGPASDNDTYPPAGPTLPASTHIPSSPATSGAAASARSWIESHLFSLSVRAWITLIIVVTYCISVFLLDAIPDSLDRLTYAVVSFYLGQKYYDFQLGKKPEQPE